MTFEIYCSKHPRYKAVNKPRAKCGACLALWNLACPASDSHVLSYHTWIVDGTVGEETELRAKLHE